MRILDMVNYRRLVGSRIWVVGMIALLLITLCFGQSRSEEETPTTTPVPMESIFPGDTCAPPCWFGITPGKTTAEEARTILPTIKNIGSIEFGDSGIATTKPQTGLPPDDIYSFYLGPWERPDTIGIPANQMYIKDGIVYKIVFQPGTFVLLSEVLEKLGKPDSVRLFGHPYFFWIHLIYLDAGLEVLLVFFPESGCRIEDAANAFWVDIITYHSAESAIEPLVVPGLEETPQPALTAYLLDERDVSESVFQSWLNGDVKETCLEAWKSLPKEVVYPTLSPTSEPTGTEQP
jgi:hypothetical protein